LIGAVQSVVLSSLPEVSRGFHLKTRRSQKVTEGQDNLIAYLRRFISLKRFLGLFNLPVRVNSVVGGVEVSGVRHHRDVGRPFLARDEAHLGGWVSIHFTLEIAASKKRLQFFANILP